MDQHISEMHRRMYSRFNLLDSDNVLVRPIVTDALVSEVNDQFMGLTLWSEVPGQRKLFRLMKETGLRDSY